jgi:pimeloyl-ACP methyl ester carboxylesterase
MLRNRSFVPLSQGTQGGQNAGTQHDIEQPLSTTRTVATERLAIAYESSGPETGRPVILLHGWPDDVRTWDRVVPALHAVGCRTFVPYLRGYGPTRFKHAQTMRSGQLSALGQDVLDFADAVGLKNFALVGHDWGARAAYIAASEAPARVSHCAGISVAYGTNAPGYPMELPQIRGYWYQWYMALEHGAARLREDRRAFTRFMWETWSPTWRFSDAEFERTAPSFDNPDWVDVVLHSYRHRWGLAPGDPDYASLDRRLSPPPPIKVPTLMLHGGADACTLPSLSEGKEALFLNSYKRVVLEGFGHFPQRENPDAVAAQLVAFLAEKPRS